MTLESYINKFHKGSLTGFAKEGDFKLTSVWRWVKEGVVPRPGAIKRVAEVTDGAVGPADFYR